MAAIASYEDADGLRCVDLIARADGTFGFKEFRRDPEDRGGWTPVADYSARVFATREDALAGAASAIAWFAVVKPVT